MSRGMLAGAAALGLLVAPAAASAQAPKDGGGGRDCFYVNQIAGQRPLNDHAVILRVNVSDYYRLEFTDRCAALSDPDPRLVLTPVGGIGLICRALDVEVKAAPEGLGAIATPCLPRSIRRMTPAEVAATPRQDLP